MLGSLVVDASRFAADLGGTLGMIDAIVFGGRLEIVVPPGVEVRSSIRRSLGGRVDLPGEPHHDSAHILLSGTVVLGRIEVRSAGPA
jgi:hypothetical protein